MVQLASGLFFINDDETEDVIVGHIDESRALPLRGIVAEAQVVDLCAEVKLHQRYENSFPNPVEAVYVFPVDERAAVSGFEARIRDRVIVADVQEKEEARATYEAAKSQGHGAYLLEECREDVFRIKVGNIPAGETVQITVTYVAELKVEGGQGDSIRFLLPTAVAPRYTPLTDPRADEPIPSTLLSSWRTGGVEGGSNLVPDGLRFHLDARSSSNIASVTSPTHAIAVTRSEEKKKEASADLAFGTASLGGDIVVLVNLAEDSSSSTRRIATLVVEEEENDKDSRACMLTLIPRFELDDVRTDIVFVIDRSGSMDGSQIEQARKAMELFLRALPTDCYFNIVGFGSRYETLFPEPTKYSQESLATASDHVKNLQANLGGTEIMQPLEAVNGMKHIPGYPRQVFVLTDGQVSNTEQVCEFVRNTSNTTRYFSLGIGAGVSHALVEGIARNGKGTAAFVHAGEPIESKVMKQLKQAIQPAITDVKIEWPDIAAAATDAEEDSSKPKSLLGYSKPEATQGPIMQTPFVVPPVFNGERFTVYALLKPGVNRPTKAIVRATTPDGPLEATVEVSEEEDIVQGDIVHRLAARSLLRDIADSSSFLHRSEAGGFRVPSAETIKSFAVQIGKRYKLASRYTSFVAVEERVGAEKVVAPVFYQRPVIQRPQYEGVACYSRAPMNNSLSLSRRSVLHESLSPVKARMAMNIDSVLQRGEALESLQDKSASLSASSSSFHAQAKRSGGGGGIGSIFKGISSAVSSAFSAPFGASSSDAAPPPPPSLSYAAAGCAPPRPLHIAQSMEGMSAQSEKRECEEDDFAAAPQQQQPSDRSERSILHSLIPLQQFDGSFNLSQQLASAANKSLDALTSAKPQHAQASWWATAIAIAVLQVFASSLSDDWEMSVNKARSWLQKELKSAGATTTTTTVAELVDAAEKILRS